MFAFLDEDFTYIFNSIGSWAYVAYSTWNTGLDLATCFTRLTFWFPAIFPSNRRTGFHAFGRRIRLAKEHRLHLALHDAGFRDLSGRLALL